MTSRIREIVGATLAAALVLPLATIAAPEASKVKAPAAAPKVTAVSTASPLAKGQSLMLQKNYALAEKEFKKAVDQAPGSCECRLKHGKALCKLAGTLKKGPEQLTNYKSGIKELRMAIRLGRGSANAKEANQILMTLPTAYISPKSGDDTPLIAMAHGIAGRTRGAGEAAKPKILEFYASWCDPCKQLKPFIAKLKDQYGEQVEVISYNVDDPNTEKIVEDYEVSPIPTLIFLDGSNQVVSYSVGYSGEAGLQKGLKKILTPGS